MTWPGAEHVTMIYLYNDGNDTGWNCTKLHIIISLSLKVHIPNSNDNDDADDNDNNSVNK